MIKLDNTPPSLHPQYRDLITTTGCSARVLRIGTFALMGLPLEGFPYHRNDTFSRSIKMPVVGSRYLYAGCHGSSNQVSLPFIPRQGQDLGFDIIYSAFDASSIVHSRSSLYYAPDIFKNAFSFIASHRTS